MEWPIACSWHAVRRSGLCRFEAAVPLAKLFVLSIFFLGCTKAPSQRFNLDSLDVTGNSELDEDEIKERIASRETSKFLGLFPGLIYEYETFNRFVLERDLQRIERFYRSRGYYQARARAAHVFRSDSKVRVEIVVEEGPPVLLRRVDLHGIERLPKELQAEARASVAAQLPLDAPFDEEKLAQAAQDLARNLGDNGYAQATVRKSADVSLPQNVAAVGFWIEAGKPSEFGEVRLEGLADLPEDQVRRALNLTPGDPYSQSDLDEGKRALLDLGVFGSVDVQPQVQSATPGPSGKPRIPILVRLEKAKLRSVRLGGGLMVDALKSDVHLTMGWEDQSFLGNMRKLQVEVTPGVVVYPTRFPSFETPERLLPEGRFRSELRQPGFVSSRTSLVLKGQAAAYPVLLSKDRDRAAPIIGYFDYRASVGVERSYHQFYASLSQNAQLNVPFVYKGTKDSDLADVLVSYPALYTTLDLRNDRIHPHKGVFLGNDVEVAGVGGDARDVKLQPEVRVYLPITKRVTLAARGSIGLLFAQNYGQSVESNALTGSPTPGQAPPPPPPPPGSMAMRTGAQEQARKDWIRDVQLMFLRGFFSGGPGSNRGYAPREIGPHGTVPFYNHGQTVSNVDGVDCTAGSGTYDAAVCDLPLGGFTLWEASLELRFPLAGELAGAVFGDASDVSSRRLSFRLNRPHLSVGFGLRYDTPVGPVRLDLGFRVPGAQAPKGAADEFVPDKFLSLPLAMSFGIGEAF